MIDAQLAIELQRRITELEQSAVRIRPGEITATSPLTVSIAGSAPYANVLTIAGQTYTVGQTVAVAQWRGSIVVLGGLA